MDDGSRDGRDEEENESDEKEETPAVNWSEAHCASRARRGEARRDETRRDGRRSRMKVMYTDERSGLVVSVERPGEGEMFDEDEDEDSGEEGLEDGWQNKM